MKHPSFYQILIVSIFLFSGTANRTTAQQTSITDVIDYRDIDGKIVLTLSVNNKPADFILDLAGETAILPDYIDTLSIDTANSNTGKYTFLHKGVTAKRNVNIKSLVLGNCIYQNNVSVLVLEETPYLRQLGVAGIIGSSFFRNVVLTLDSRHKKITASQPYRPSYMKLTHRTDITPIKNGIVFTLTIGDSPQNFLFDTWSNTWITLTPEDFAAYETSLAVKFTDNDTSSSSATLPLPTCTFVKTKIEGGHAIQDSSISYSTIGLELLKHGILSIDFGREKVYFQPFDLVPITFIENDDSPQITITDGKVNPITRDYFLHHIFDYRKSDDFILIGNKPVVIDFWATWCGPCMRLMPEMEKLAQTYKGKVIFYKINADQEKELCQYFGIEALPTLFFIPVGGKPIIEIGAIPEKYKQIIEEKLLSE